MKLSRLLGKIFMRRIATTMWNAHYIGQTPCIAIQCSQPNVAKLQREAGILMSIAWCKAAKASGKAMVFKPHLIVATTTVPKDLEVLRKENLSGCQELQLTTVHTASS